MLYKNLIHEFIWKKKLVTNIFCLKINKRYNIDNENNTGTTSNTNEAKKASTSNNQDINYNNNNINKNNSDIVYNNTDNNNGDTSNNNIDKDKRKADISNS